MSHHPYVHTDPAPLSLPENVLSSRELSIPLVECQIFECCARDPLWVGFGVDVLRAVQEIS